MAEQADQLKLRIKGGPQSNSQHSWPTTKAVHIKTGTTIFDKSGRKKYLTARPRCLVHRAHHCTAEHAAGSTCPAPAPAMSRYNSLWPSGQSQPHIQAVHPPSQPTGCLFTIQQPCSMPQSTPLGEPSSTQTKHGILGTAL
jgi:hypothetical protein